MRDHVHPELPPCLYKYLPARGAISLLKNRQFWLRCPLQFHDTWDCRVDLLGNLDVAAARRAYRHELVQLLCGRAPPPPPYALGGYLLHALRRRERPWTPAEVDSEYGDLISCAFENLQEHIGRIQREQETLLRRVRVLCLCEEPASARMWEGYAENGRGACIGFQYVPTLDNIVGAAKPVRYVDRWPTIATPVEWARHILFIEPIPFGPRARESLYVKLEQWRHEKEWRIIAVPRSNLIVNRDGVYAVTIDPPEVVEVRLGWALTRDQVMRITELVRAVYPHVALHETKDGRISAPAELARPG